MFPVHDLYFNVHFLLYIFICAINATIVLFMLWLTVCNFSSKNTTILLFNSSCWIAVLMLKTNLFYSEILSEFIIYRHISVSSSCKANSQNLCIFTLYQGGSWYKYRRHDNLWIKNIFWPTHRFLFLLKGVVYYQYVF